MYTIGMQPMTTKTGGIDIPLQNKETNQRISDIEKRLDSRITGEETIRREGDNRLESIVREALHDFKSDVKGIYDKMDTMTDAQEEIRISVASIQTNCATTQKSCTDKFCTLNDKLEKQNGKHKEECKENIAQLGKEMEEHKAEHEKTEDRGLTKWGIIIAAVLSILSLLMTLVPVLRP